MKSVFVLILLGISINLTGQKFLNSDLEGIITSSSPFPADWINIPASDVNCRGLVPGVDDTPDLTYLNGPAVNMGVIGNPYSGTTFISGLVKDTANHFYHEGIMQSVSNLTPGTTYQFGFFQAVVKDSQCLDTSGSWAVYVDTTLLAITDPSISTLPFNSTNLFWDYHIINFTAIDSIHLFKFLPQDDDTLAISSPNNSAGCLRMGIDNIAFLKGVEIYPSTLLIPNIFTPNNDGHNDLLTPTQIEGMEKLEFRIYNRWGTLVYSTNDININWSGKDCVNGTYFWIAEFTDINGIQGTQSGAILLVRN